MAAQMNRRGFLAGLAATSALVAFPRPLWAQALPVVNEATAVQRVASTAFKNYVGRVGASLTASQLATVTAAANDNLAATAVRVGARSGVAVLAPFVASATPIVAGVVVAGALVGAAYLAYRYFNPTSESGNKTSITTFEQALASSNWSMRNKTGWSLWKQQATSGGWQAWWLWTPPSGQTQADFDHQTHVAPYQTNKNSVTDLNALLAQAPTGLPVEPAWMQQAMHALMVDTADKAAAAGTPLPEPFANPATVPAFVPADFPQDAPWPGPGAMTQPLPDIDGATSGAPHLINTPEPVGGTNPDPDPDPDPGTPDNAVSIDWGDAPEVEQLPNVTPMSWFPNPFQAPQLSGTCSGWTIPVTQGLPVTLDPCPLMADMTPVVRPVIAVSATIAAGKILLDI